MRGSRRPVRQPSSPPRRQRSRVRRAAPACGPPRAGSPAASRPGSRAAHPMRRAPVHGQGHGREEVPIHPVVEVEVTWEAGAGVLRLGPGAPLLALAEEGETAPAGGLLTVAAPLQRHHRPGGLRGGADAHAGEALVLVGVAGLAPASVRVLHLEQPPDGPGQMGACRSGARRAPRSRTRSRRRG